MTFLEVCVENADAAERAVEAGAGRIELCATLAQGGLTPDVHVIRSTLERMNVPVHVMVRCRAGSFRYDSGEMGRMEAEVDVARRSGVNGFVFGAVDADGRIDVSAVSRILERAGSLPVTFHRAFDQTADLHKSLDALIALGIPRVLTSGGAPTAWEGRACLRDLVHDAAGRIVVMAGGGVRPKNVEQLIAETGVTEVHSSVPFMI